MAVMTSIGLPAHQLDTDTYERIVDSGALEGQRVELIDGIIVDMSPQSEEHSGIIARLMTYLAAWNAKCLLRVQMPMHVTAANSLPEPDLAVTAAPSDLRSHPLGALLVIEVAVSSQTLDRGRKQELYAATGVPVYWLVDVPARSVEVRTDPGAGGYGAVAVYADAATVPAPLADVEPLALAELFAGL